MLVGSGGVLAGQACGEREAVITHLEKKYKEVVRSVGITSKGELIEVTVAPDGPACLIGSGENWRSIEVIEGIKA